MSVWTSDVTCAPLSPSPGKNRRLKQAKEEAQAEIEQYRLQREKEFKTKEAAVRSLCTFQQYNTNFLNFLSVMFYYFVSSHWTCSPSPPLPSRPLVPMVTARWRWTVTRLSGWDASRPVTAVTRMRCWASCCDASATSSRSFTLTTVWLARGGATSIRSQDPEGGRGKLRRHGC